MSSCEFLCVQVSVERVIVQQGGIKRKRAKNVLEARQRCRAGGDFTLFELLAKKQRSPETLIPQDFRASLCKKKITQIVSNTA